MNKVLSKTRPTLASIFLLVSVLSCNEKPFDFQDKAPRRKSEPQLEMLPASISKDLESHFEISIKSGTVTNLPDLSLTPGESLTLKIEVKGNPQPTIEWYYSPRYQDYEFKTGTRLDSSDYSHQNIFSIEQVTLQQHGYYWAKVYNLLNRDTPVYSQRVKVGVGSDDAKGCILYPSHGSERVFTFYQYAMVPFESACESKTYTSVCIDGQMYFADRGDAHNRCYIEEAICKSNNNENCEHYDSITLTPPEGGWDVDHNNPLFELNCPETFEVKLFRQSGIDARIILKESKYDCTGESIFIQPTIEDGDYSITLLGYPKTGFTGNEGIKKYLLNVNGAPAYKEMLKPDYVMNLDTKNDPTHKKVLIGELLSHDLLESYPNPYSLVELFLSYNFDLSSEWNTNNLTSSFDFSGVAWNISKAGTLVTKRHILVATHWANGVGTELLFHDVNGNAVTRTVIGSRPVPDSDTTVQLLDSDVPDTVKVYKMLSWKSNLIEGATILMTNRLRQAGLSKIRRSNDSQILWHSASLLEQDLVGAKMTLTSGDSGNPSFLVVNGELVVVMTHSTTVSGPNFANREMQNKIQAAIYMLF